MQAAAKQLINKYKEQFQGECQMHTSAMEGYLKKIKEENLWVFKNLYSQHHKALKIRLICDSFTKAISYGFLVISLV